MSDRTPEFIRDEWANFQKNVERCTGSYMSASEAEEILDSLITEHRRGMFESKFRGWLPKDLIELRSQVTKVPDAKKAVTPKAKS